MRMLEQASIPHADEINVFVELLCDLSVLVVIMLV